MMKFPVVKLGKNIESLTIQDSDGFVIASISRGVKDKPVLSGKIPKKGKRVIVIKYRN